MILLLNRELEPYFVYEWAAKEFEIDSTAISFEDLAKTTQELYFPSETEGCHVRHIPPRKSGECAYQCRRRSHIALR